MGRTITKLLDRLDDMSYPTRSITEAHDRGPYICHLSSVIFEPKARMRELIGRKRRDNGARRYHVSACTLLQARQNAGQMYVSS